MSKYLAENMINSSESCSGTDSMRESDIVLYKEMMVKNWNSSDEVLLNIINSDNPLTGSDYVPFTLVLTDISNLTSIALSGNPGFKIQTAGNESCVMNGFFGNLVEHIMYVDEKEKYRIT